MPASLRSLAIFLGVLAGAGRALAADRVGSETCRACHAAAYATWQGSMHAKAASSLTPAQREDGRCVHCHAPDLVKATQETSADSASAHTEAGVGCEACHGPGQYYSPVYVMRDAELARAVGLVDPGQKSCLVCHTGDAPSLTPFDYAAMVKRIDHWSQAGGKKTPEKSKGRVEIEPPHDKIHAPLREGLAQGTPR